MPQIIVDTATESPASLSLISRLLQDYAIAKAKEERAAETEYPTVAAHTHPVPTLEEDPAKLFAKPTPAPAPIAPAVIVPLASATAAPAADTAGVTAKPVEPAAAVAGETARNPATSTDLDKAGVPWDSRIHSSAKGQKKDGTWKLARNVDPALVTMVLQEITPKPHVVNGAVVPVAPPVTVPVATAVPMPPVAPLGTGAVPDAAAGSGAHVPVAPVAAAGGVLNPVQQFQAFMKLVAEGQASVPPRFTHADVLAACAAEGVPQLQLVITAPDKIPAIKTRLGIV